MAGSGWWRMFVICYCGLAVAWAPPTGFSEHERVFLGHDDFPNDVSGYPKTFIDLPFSGLTTYAGIPYVNCLSSSEEPVDNYDIAILGAPFDTVRELVPGSIQPTIPLPPS